MKRKIGMVLVMLGVLLMLGPRVGQIYVQQQQNELYEIYNAQIIEYQKDEREVEVVENVWELPTFEKGEVMGEIIIPKIEVNLLIIQGDEEEQLSRGIGHSIESRLPGEVGNCVLMGHRNYTFGEYFNRLDELEEGDEIIIMSYNQEFYYKVGKKFIVEQTELWVTEDTEEEILTLITCHPIWIGNKRLIVQAVRAD